MEAIQDATKAIEFNPLSHKAHLRKGVALFNLDEFEAAKEVFEAGYAVEPLPIFKTWLRKCEAELGEEKEAIIVHKPKAVEVVPIPQSDLSKSEVIVAEHETAEDEVRNTVVKENETAEEEDKRIEDIEVEKKEEAQENGFSPLEEKTAASSTVVDASKYRFQHYQIQNKLTLDIYAKKLKPEQVLCRFAPHHLTVEISTVDRVLEFRLDIDLYGEIQSGDSKYEILGSKVEVVLVKANNLVWPSLEKSDKIAVATATTPSSTLAPSLAMPTPSPASISTFPTSSVVKKDWSQVDHELSELEEKGELDSGDPLNNFFKKIFKDGDETTRRAMMKSFVESNGTVLSTNWKEVGQKKVECTPPEGMDVRKWSS
uniref:Uncharacterized protein n=1 Tax=Polytomella parva TaxID=51329 RepID=A0A7S0VE09_9CHLO